MNLAALELLSATLCGNPSPAYPWRIRFRGRVAAEKNDVRATLELACLPKKGFRLSLRDDAGAARAIAPAEMPSLKMVAAAFLSRAPNTQAVFARALVDAICALT
jgi:hypothetical protein